MFKKKEKRAINNRCENDIVREKIIRTALRVPYAFPV